MTWMDVVGGAPPPTFPGSQGYSEYYALSANPPAAPSGLSATAISSSAIDLTWTDNSNDETGFNIERSLTGTSFSPLASVGANETSYNDTGLSPNTTYWYRVNAENGEGTSAWSDIASVTTLQDGGGGDPTTVDLGSVVVTTVNVGQGNKIGRATVVVVDDLGGPVEGAIVTGDFSGTFPESGVTGPATDATGTTVIDTTGSAKGSVSLTFCVTSITHSDLNDWTGPVCASN